MRDPRENGLIGRIARRAFVFATHMIWEANHRDDRQEGDPKVGGHPAACSSCVHIMAALHLGVRQAQDFIAVKPHGSPTDHALNYLLGFLHEPCGRRWLDDREARDAMRCLRKFSHRGQPVFQAYHAESDPDGNIFMPSGSVGIPPVVSVYTALAYRYAKDHDFEVPEGAHFWSLIGDSEFREGSLMEVLPDAAERELGNVTWIVDYNRQNLDETRMPNMRGLRRAEGTRMEKVAVANGWDVIQCMHGSRRLEAFTREGGGVLQKLLEEGFSDFEFQALLLRQEGAVVRERLHEMDARVERVLEDRTDEEVYALFADLGGHDVAVMLDALRRSKLDPINPTLIVAHTIKGWGLKTYAAPGNHSTLPEEDEVMALLRGEGLTTEEPYQRFDVDSDEGRYLAHRGRVLRGGQEALWALKDRNERVFRESARAGIPATLGLNLSCLPSAHTQYVWRQLAAKLMRIANKYHYDRTGHGRDERVTDDELRWGPAADVLLTMAPDVGPSTSVDSTMKLHGPTIDGYDGRVGVTGRRRPQLTPKDDAWTRHIRFEIAEANCMSAVGAFGKMRDHVGIPFLPVMTVYDFFIKRAFDQLYYNLYWGSGFICMGTPSGVTLAPEGAQHSWKSDIAMPNIIIWEPFFALEMDWILSDAVRRHFVGDDRLRSGVIIRAVTRSFRQAELLKRLKTATRAAGRSDEEILEAARQDALQGAYYLQDWRGHPGYEPGENVVHIFTMGAMGVEALAASDRLVKDGIYANVIVATCGDLLCGNLAHADGYRHLTQNLGINGDLHLVSARNGSPRGASSVTDRADLVMAAGRRVPIVAVVDGEPGILDNLGSIVGVKCEALAVRKASKSGRPVDVYRYHGIDADGIYRACGRVLSETALENVRISTSLLASGGSAVLEDVGHEELWPPDR